MRETKKKSTTRDESDGKFQHFFLNHVLANDKLWKWILTKHNEHALDDHWTGKTGGMIKKYTIMCNELVNFGSAHQLWDKDSRRSRFILKKSNWVFDEYGKTKSGCIKKHIAKLTSRYNKLKAKVGLDGRLAKCLLEKRKIAIKRKPT